MKCIKRMLLITTFLVGNSVASDIDVLGVSIEGSAIGVYLNVHNTSNGKVDLELSGDAYLLEPESGVSFFCNGYEMIELQFVDRVHNLLTVPCGSVITIDSSYEPQK